jgi:hypothetical protein
MTYKARLKVNFDTEWTPNYGGSGIYDDEMLPEEHYTFEISTEDINTIQLFRFFGTIARTMGFDEQSIMKGACSLAFNDMRSFEDMKKVADEYDLYLAEEYSNKVIPLENKNYELEKQVRDLKAKLARCENPDAEQYLDEEIEAMTAENESNN